VLISYITKKCYFDDRLYYKIICKKINLLQNTKTSLNMSQNPKKYKSTYGICDAELEF